MIGMLLRFFLFRMLGGRGALIGLMLWIASAVLRRPVRQMRSGQRMAGSGRWASRP
jgi:hypothetical protein